MFAKKPFFFPRAPQPPPPLSSELSTEQDRGDSAQHGEVVHWPPASSSHPVLFWASALRGGNCAQPMVKSWITETSHIHLKKKKNKLFQVAGQTSPRWQVCCILAEKYYAANKPIWPTRGAT